MTEDNEGQLIYTPAWNQAIGSAETIARVLRHEAVNPEHLFLAILLDPNGLPSQVVSKHADRRRLIAALRAELEGQDYSRSAVRGDPPDDTENRDRPASSGHPK
ncbi:Clp protease N-terminal domain-containing protein [Streptomyces lavendofoliae]|uniref:Clp protease N-terminal domain-containing protein n=1 Tax=Streptomyces lavendofoliae TaxID=67314 RepID=UPI003D89CE40